MEQEHGGSKRKTSGSGGKVRRACIRRLYEIGGPFTATKVGEKDRRVVKRARGGNGKVKLKRAAYVNVLLEDGMRKARIKNVTETPSNRNYARQKIIVKGAILDTEVGKVRVTNRVGQDGVVNGVPI